MFVDESGRPEEKTFAVGGIVVEAAHWGVLRELWQTTLGDYQWPLDRELKWHGRGRAR